MEHVYSEYYDFEKYKVIDCESCGYKHLYPMPTKEELEEFYKKEYYETKSFIDSRKLSDSEKKIYSEMVLKDEKYIEYNRIVEKFNKSKNKRMMDIGCQTSLRMLSMKERGWEPIGIEPNGQICYFNEELGINVHNTVIEEFDFKSEGKMDLINIEFVLEHILNPFDVLNKCYEALNPGGLLYISVPNEFNLFQMAYAKQDKQKMFWVNLPDHINYFNFETLEQLCAKIGFDLVYKTTVFPVDMFLAEGIDYKNDETKIEVIRRYITDFENNMKQSGDERALYNYYEKLATIGLGRSCLMYFRKPI